MLARLQALEQMERWARAGERESAGANRSALIDRINQSAGVPVGSPYCAAAIAFAFKVAAGISDFGGTLGDASVGYLEKWARDKGWLHTRPFRGDAFAWQLDGDTWPDHAGMVRKVISWGGLLFTVDTVEANTSSSAAGSQDEGCGFHFRRRTFRRGRVLFVRDPRESLKNPEPVARTTGQAPEPRPSSRIRRCDVAVDGKLVLRAQRLDSEKFLERLPRLILRAKHAVTIDIREGK